ncbi:guided entry of tail-anchored proteins factor 1-like [Toxorhynchites rutilus septentrionalis]|uniref:guided entry of tail-anchored proteins factor 1-like n=1 Tax=Toxorhynchites rutilus septentrionalis TaxID=329112 RepID=UPI00247A23B5|nr:guided entry of tail-anchored proteins factor 1-like [Toxorhynchites rutilus septentrionalis]
MYLLLVITIICFLMPFVSKITKLILLMVFRESLEVRALRAESEHIKRELSKISMRDDYIKYVKVERKLVAVDTKLNEAKSGESARRMVYEYGIQYGAYAILALSLVIISIFYRYTPVVVFGKNFNFAPFERVLSFPTGVPNSVSCVFWIVVNNFVARTCAGYIK